MRFSVSVIEMGEVESCLQGGGLRGVRDWTVWRERGEVDMPSAVAARTSQ